MTEEQWEVFVPLYEDFIKCLNEGEQLVFNQGTEHIPEIYPDAVDFTTSTYSRCDGTEYYTHELNKHFFIDGERELALNKVKLVKEETIRLAKLAAEKSKLEAEKRLRERDLETLTYLKKKYE